MKIPFNLEKAMAATSILLGETEHRCMEYLRLLKLLYIADREILAKSDAPLLGSRLVAMKNGPLHSRVFDLIKGEDSSATTWQKFFTTHSYSIRLNEPAAISSLSRFEIRKLKEVSDKFRNVGTWELVDMTHDFPEWKKAYPDPTENTSRPIEFAAVIEAVGRIDDKEHLESLMMESIQFDSL
jgi:uncharacterized phage-associated protein